MKKIRKEKGITLIALAITIIVLLILAGISLILIMRNGGILEKAETAVKQTEQAKIQEEIEMVLAEIQMEEEQTITLEMLASGTLQEKLPGITSSLKDHEIIGNYKEYFYKITENLKVILNDDRVTVVAEIQETISEQMWYKTDVTVILKGQDGREQTIQKIIYQLNDGQEIEVLEKETNVKIEQEGENRLYFYAVTNDGIRTETFEQVIKIDKTLPTDVEIIENEILGSDVLLNLRATDEISGISKFEIYVDDEKYIETEENTVEIKKLSSNKQHTIYIKAMDQAGNVSEKSENIVIQTTKVYVQGPLVFEEVSFCTSMNGKESDIDYLEILFDGDLSRDRGILIDNYWGNYLVFSTDENVKVEAFGDTYQDTGGSSDNKVFQISKYNQENKRYEIWKEVQTIPRQWYEIADFEPGRYKIESKKDGRRYTRFDEWRIVKE